MRKITLKVLIPCIALFMAVLMCFGSTLDIFAESTTLYVTDIRIDSEQALLAEGYKVVSANAGSISSSGTLYLGYKTSKNKSEAITDIKAMNMYGGFSQFDIESVMSQNAESIAKTSNEIWTAIGEFKENLEGTKQNTPAKIALDALNCLYVPETGDKLGDFLISSDRTITDISRIVLMSTSMVMSYIINTLMLGVSDNMAESGSTTWLQRAVEIGTFSFSGMSQSQINEFYKKYDKIYYQRAYNLLLSIQQFAELYNEALQVFPDGIVDEETYNEACEKISNGEITSALNGETEADMTGDYVYALSAMEFLDSTDEYGYIYYYGSENQSFGEYILEAAKTAETDEEAACRMLYPLIADMNGKTALTEGQETLMGLTSFAMFVLVTANENNAYNTLRKEYDAGIKTLLDANNGELISVWYGVNTEVYENTDSLYLTSALSRETAATSRYDIITTVQSETEQKSIEIKNAMLTAAQVGVSALGAGAIALVVSTKFVTTTVAFGFTCVSSPVTLLVCHIVEVAVVVIVVVVIIVLIVMLIKYLKEKDKEEQSNAIEFVWLDIPKIIYDLGKSDDVSVAISYVGVKKAKEDDSKQLRNSFLSWWNTTETSEPVDLNQGKNSNIPWLCLYYTRDVNAGSPITVPEDGSCPFILNTNGSKPEGYSSVTFFEEIIAANINEGSYNAYKYLFMHREDEGESDPVEGKYLSDVILESQASQDGALGAIRSKGYTPVQTNLTPYSGVYTYLGYKTTDIESDAITDLRVAVGSGVDKGGGKLTYGVNTYGLCGYVGNLMLFQSKLSTAGTPILASGSYELNGQTVDFSGLFITNNMNNAPEGYEPVILYSGGPAFDFANCGDWETLTADDEGKLKSGVGCESSWGWNDHIYVYFNPSVKFTSGEKYLGGLAFFSVPGGALNGGTKTVFVYNSAVMDHYYVYNKYWQNPDTSYISAMGWNILNNTDLGGYQYGTCTYLCYSETYNPYRAIYDIKYYANTDRNKQGVAFNLSYNSLGYTACDVFAQGGGNLGNDLRTMRITHAYRSNMFYEGGSMTDMKTALDYFLSANNGIVPSKTNGYWELGENDTICPIRCVALYVTGNSSKDISMAEPLTKDDLVFTNKSDSLFDSSQYTPLRSFTDAYADYSVNLGGDTLVGSSNLYMFIKRADANADKPKYIASVSVAYSNGNNTTSPFDDTILSLISNGDGQLYKYNLSGDSTEFAKKYYNLELDDGKVLGISIDDPYTVQYGIFNSDYSKNAKVAYMWITYTDVPSQAISDLVIYESDSATAPDRIDYYYTEDQVSPTSAYKCGNGWQEDGNSTYFFLYAIHHNGHYVTDIVCDDNAMLTGYWTTLTDYLMSPSLSSCYIHTAHNTYEGAYLAAILIGTGSSKDEALRDLLDQGCQTCLEMDINVNQDDQYTYIGLQYTGDYTEAYTGLLLLESGQNNKITRIENGWDKYSHISDDLNSASKDIIVKLYGSKSTRLAKINKQTGENGRYVADIIFAPSSDASFTSYDKNHNQINWNLVRDPDGNAQAVCIGASYEQYTKEVSWYEHEYKTFLWFVIEDKATLVTKTYVVRTDKGFQSNLYMYVHYSDNSIESGSQLSSVLGGNGSVLAVIAGTVIIATAVFIVIRKKKHIQPID